MSEVQQAPDKHDVCFACDELIEEGGVTIEFRTSAHGGIRIHMACFDGVAAERVRLREKYGEPGFIGRSRAVTTPRVVRRLQKPYCEDEKEQSDA